MEIYFDNAATTRVYDEVIDLMAQIMRVDYGNPSSLHMKGVEAERYIREARKTLARILKVQEKEIIFTSGGSESNNMALFGAARAYRRSGKHIISTRIEHASVYNPLIELEKEGWEVYFAGVDRYGTVSVSDIADHVREDTTLVSVMCVNNEIGTIQPIADIAREVKKKNPHTLIHVDAIQGFGKMILHPGQLGIDLLSVSGHKIHGPKGTGFLWIRDGVRVLPLIYGGGHQHGMRSGTENVPGTAGMAAAAQIEYTDIQEKLDRLYSLRAYFIDRVLALPGTHVNGGLKRGSLSLADREDAACCAAPHVVSVSFDDIRAEVLLHALEERQIYVSSGSACSSNHPGISGTLKAAGVPGKLLDSTIRFSFSFDTTKEEIDACMEVLSGLLPMLRRFVPGGRKRK